MSKGGTIYIYTYMYLFLYVCVYIYNIPRFAVAADSIHPSVDLL